MKISLITVGKIKEKYLKDAIAEYSKRLSKYCKLEIIEVADEKTPDQASKVVENGIRTKEAERIMKYIKEDSYVVTLEIRWNICCTFPVSSGSDLPRTAAIPLLSDRNRIPAAQIKCSAVLPRFFRFH